MIDSALWALVQQRAGNRCEYCRLPQRYAPFSAFHIEHIRAKQHGGTDDPLNLGFSCNRCNLSKGPNLAGIDSDTGSMVALFNPRTDSWDDHFAFHGTTIVGLTPIGRATVHVLNMNELRRLRSRAALMARGQYG